MAYMVRGGVHKDFTFSEVQEGKEEIYGPFETLEKATDAWKQSVWLNVDNALHRMLVIQE